jgi:ribosomal protein L29
MKISEIREMTKEQSLEKLATLYRAEAVQRMKMNMNDTKNTSMLGKIKKQIARILTVLNEKSEVVS